MADRVSVAIIVGGVLDAVLKSELIDVIQLEGLSNEWDGEPFDESQLPEDGPLHLYGHEIANGELDELETFCCSNGLPFRRWSGGSSGAFPPEIVVWTGQGEHRRYTANEDECAVITSDDAKSLDSYDAILRYFAEAGFEVPALRFE